MKVNKVTYVAILFVFLLLLICIEIMSNKINDSSIEKEKKTFPDHSIMNEDFYADYPSPVKQLQQVLSHSYVNEPTDDDLKIGVDLGELKFESSPELISTEIDDLQKEINKLRKAMDRTANE